jgi:hypothetical protein
MRPPIVLVLLLVAAPASAADNQIRPFVGGTFGGGTTFVDLEHAAGKWNPVLGVSFVTLKNIFGLDVELADAPGFFQGDDSGLVLSSRVTTLTGNVVVAAPRSKTEYGLRPYLLGGAGIMRTRKKDYFAVFPETRVLAAIDVGAGAVGFFTNRSGVSWEIRRFEGLGGTNEVPGTTLGKPPRLSFWRATMAFVYRY